MYICEIDSNRIEIPSKWDDLTKNQLLTVVRLFYNGLGEIHLKTQAVLSFLKIQMAKIDSTHRAPDELYLMKHKKGKPFYASPEQILFLARSLDFLTVEELDHDIGVSMALSSSLTTNLIPSFKIGFNKYYGVSDRLFTMTFDEYLEAEVHYKAYMTNSDLDSLNKLIGSIYRPKAKNNKETSTNYNGDPREAFNSNLVDLYAKKFKKLNPEIKIAILLFYQGCRKFLHLNFKHVFEQSSSGSTSKGYGSLSLIDALTGDDVTKNKKVRTSMLFEVLVRLEKAAIKYEQSKQN